MKTAFTFLLILVLAISSSAQNVTSSIQKNGASFSGIATENQTFSIAKVYPNPVKDFVTVEIKSGISGTIQISLINILGTEVKKFESISLKPGDQQFKIDLSSFKTGVYFLKISNSGHVCTQVLKKN